MKLMFSFLPAVKQEKAKQIRRERLFAQSKT